MLNRVAGARLPGLQAPALAAAVCALAYLPVLVLLVGDGRLAGAPLGYALAAGVLSSVVPYAADLTALRFVPPRFFGVFMSTHPVLAALVGMVMLGQAVAAHEWAGIAVVVLANAAAITTASRPRETRESGAEKTSAGMPARAGRPVDR